MKPFEKKSYIEPKGIDKLLKKFPTENFLIDVNNLLAENSLDEITVGQIQHFAEKYKLKDASQRYKTELLQILSEFLKQHLNAWGDKYNDFSSAKRLQNLLGISDIDFNNVYRPIATDIFKMKVTDTLNRTKKCQDEEESLFEQFRTQLELTEGESNQIQVDIRHSIVLNYITSMISDFRVSPEEIATYEKLCKDLSVSVKMDEDSRNKFEKFKKLWFIENGTLPVYESEIILQKGELCHYKTIVQLHENRKVTTGVNYGGPVFRLKIAKGLYYRAGSISATRNSQDVMTLIDSGILYITNKRILFNGSKGNKPIRYNQIIDLIPYSDGVQIIKETGKPHTFIMNYPDGEILAATITRIIRDNQ